MTAFFVEDLEIELVRKIIKNIHLRIEPPEGRVRVAVPHRVSDKSVRDLVLRKMNWIKRHQAKFQEMARQAEQERTNGESYDFLGQRYRLNIIERPGRSRVVLGEGACVMDLYLPAGSSPEKRKQVVQRWYRDQMRNLVPPLFERWAPRLGVCVSQWGIKKMKTRWGSCNTRARRIWLNLELAKRPLACIEYVVVHELVHLVERSHNHRFKKIMDSLLPQWRLHRQQLNQLPLG